MNKFPTTTILAIAGAVVSITASISNLSYGEKIRSLEDDRELQIKANQIQRRMIQEQDQLLINLYTEVERLKMLTDGFMPAPKPSVPSIIQL